MLVFTVFLVLGLLLVGMTMLDVLDEQKFLKTAEKTTGEVVGTIGAKSKASHLLDAYAGEMVGQSGAVVNFNRTYLVVRYTTQMGKSYQRQSTKSYTGKIDLSRPLEVFYNPKYPRDAMIDGHYKVSIGHKVRIIMGGVFALTSLIGMLITNFV